MKVSHLSRGALVAILLSSVAIAAPVYNFHIDNPGASEPPMMGLAAAPDPAGASAVWYRGFSAGLGNVIMTNSQGVMDRIHVVELGAVFPDFLDGFEQVGEDPSVPYVIQRKGFSFTADGYPITIHGAKQGAVYDLYVYGSRGNATSVTVNGQTETMTAAVNLDDTWVEGEEYVRFEGLTGATSYTFTSAKAPGSSRYQINGFQLVETNSGLTADIDGDGDVDGRDLLEWQMQLGSGTASLAQMVNGLGSGYQARGAIPEPASASLLALGGVALLVHRRRFHGC